MDVYRRFPQVIGNIIPGFRPKTFCRLPNVQKLPDTTDEKVPVDVPLPLPVADALLKNTWLIVQGRTHVRVDGSNPRADQIMTGFVLHPTAPLDTSRTGNPCPHQTTLPGDVPCEDGSGD